MSTSFIPDDFEVPRQFFGPGFHLEPLGPEHNERDHEAWMSSIEHIRSSPGMNFRSWPAPMSLEENLADMEMHAREFEERKSFTYSILDGDEVIGCVYIYPGETSDSANVRSWVRESRAAMDTIVRESLDDWLREMWPFSQIAYAVRH
ncbi:MAG: N-acetyltransferase [Actinobacteria bacterium]|mgnify:CR=1 FL=1|nr:MAG: N-acetyltransferase [Actinomycetota bacterium]